MRPRRLLPVLAACVLAPLAVVLALPGTTSSFTDTTANSGSTFTAAADWTPPTVSATLVQKSQGGATGRIRQGGTFHVYANASDSGNPASGVASVTADVSAVATVASAPMTAGTFSVAGTTYGYRSAQLTAKAVLPAGSYSVGVSATDGAGKTSATTTSSVLVDNTAFAGADFTTTNRGATAGRLEAGDQMSFVYNKAPDPESIVAGWDGSATSVTVSIADGGLYGTGANGDLIAPVNAEGKSLPTGYANMSGDYVASGLRVGFPNSTMTLSGSTITLTLGTPDNAANLKTDTRSRAPIYYPSASAFDLFGNAASTASVLAASKPQF